MPDGGELFDDMTGTRPDLNCRLRFLPGVGKALLSKDRDIVCRLIGAKEIYPTSARLLRSSFDARLLLRSMQELR